MDLDAIFKAYDVRGLYPSQLDEEVAYRAGRALVDLTKAVTLDPNNSEAYLNRGMTVAARGDNPGAIADFTKAVQLGKPEPVVAAARKELQRLQVAPH
jgi:regulator of sirC expression with transglutaminase-like and TPR domain